MTVVIMTSMCDETCAIRGMDHDICFTSVRSVDSGTPKLGWIGTPGVPYQSWRTPPVGGRRPPGLARVVTSWVSEADSQAGLKWSLRGVTRAGQVNLAG